MKVDQMRQLVLGVGLRDEAVFASYFPGRNAMLVQALQRSSIGQGERILYLYGPTGSGRSHLLQACCHAAHQVGLSACYLPLSMGHFSPAMLEGLASRDLVCLDDVHVLAGQSIAEEALFHAFNQIHDAGGTMIIASAVLPMHVGFSLPDLVSRLYWGIVFQLHALSDAEKCEMLIVRAAYRGMQLSEEVGRFILRHCSRDMAALCEALAILDRTSLAAQRRLTIPFVKSVLAIP